MSTHSRTGQCSRRGSIVVLTVFLLIGMVALLAFALDLGVVYTRRTELQRTADAAAIAGAWRLLDEHSALNHTPPDVAAARAQETAAEYAGLNPVGNVGPELPSEDITVGHLNVITDKAESIDPASTQAFNAVSARVQRTTEQNGATPLFFGRLLGRQNVGQTAEATAAFWCSFQGFRMPTDGSNLGIVPITIDEDSWNLLVDQWRNYVGTDRFSWNETTKSLVSGSSDNIPEGNLYPDTTITSAGNRGTVDIGSSGNSTADLVRQITQGLSEEDLAYHGGELKLDASGMLQLNGDTGISAALKDALEQIKGEPRVIPIFREYQYNGDNATYTIVGFAGVRVMDVQLGGSIKRKKVIIQPAATQIKGGIPYTGGSNSPTLFIYSPVVLVR